MPKNNKKSKGKKTSQGPEDGLSSPVLAKRSGPSELDRDDSKPTQAAVQHEDPFGDEFEDEQILEDDDDDNGMEDDRADGVAGGGSSSSSSSSSAGVGEMGAVRPWFKPGVDKLGEDEELVMDPAAYIMHHALNAEWPALSFDVLKDDLGGNRTKFPLTIFAVAGSQAATPGANKLTVMKLSDLHRIPRAQREEDDGDEEAGIDLENADSDDDEECDEDPTVDFLDVPHPAGVNRVRSCPQRPGVVATWGDDSKVRIYDLTAHGVALAGKGPKLLPGAATVAPVFEFGGHADEGFAMDWSKVAPGWLATGDCAGKIHVWQPSEGSSMGPGATNAGAAAGGGGGGGAMRWNVEAAGRAEHQGSVEDLQWSPTEATVFISCGVDRSIKVWDVREPRRSMVSQAAAHDSDVNVISWNPSVAYLLASGADDGCFKVWDLRAFGKGPASAPVANFRWHTQPVTSLEWHPTDESVLAVSSDDDSITVWDMSVEEDAESAMGASAGTHALPPQLLFIHQGQKSIKEVHFHPQVPGVLMSTALDGFNIFKPAANI